MGCPSIFTRNVAVDTHRVALERFVTYVACLSGAKGQPVLSPVMWQWTRTESPSKGLSHTWHVSAVRKASQSSRVIFVALESASTPLMWHSSSCSDSKKCSAALGPRYSTGGSVWPSNRTTMHRVAQSVGHLTRKSGVLGSIPGLATYFRFSFRFFKKGSCQLLAKV